MTIKRLIKSFLPKSLLSGIQQIKKNRRDAWLKNATTKEIFSDIYNNNLWGKTNKPGQPFYSGSGSHNDSITTAYINAVRIFLEGFPHKPAVVDLGCGDFSIGSRIRPLCGQYIACDIVPQLIDFNKSKFSSLNVDFRVLDLTDDELPKGEVVFIRQVLQHLSNDRIRRLIPKLSPSFKYLILTEHLPKSDDFIPNLDHQSGFNIRLNLQSGIVLTKAPFNLMTLEEKTLCEVEEYGGIIRTTMYRLN